MHGRRRGKVAVLAADSIELSFRNCGYFVTIKLAALFWTGEPVLGLQPPRERRAKFGFKIARLKPEL